MFRRQFDKWFTYTSTKRIMRGTLTAGLMSSLILCSAFWQTEVNAARRAGNLDFSFGASGFVRTGFKDYAPFSTWERATGSATQSDGKFVVAGYTHSSALTDSDVAIARYNPDGTLDTSFDGDGKLTLDIGTLEDNSNEFAHDVLIQPDGKIVVVGKTEIFFLVLRFNTNGSLDTSFDDDGIVVTTALGTNIAAQFLAASIQADGKIVAVGAVNLIVGPPTFTQDSVIVRYQTNGKLDETFDGDGIIVIDAATGNRDDMARDVAIQSDGKIVSAGYADLSSTVNDDFALLRVNTNGSLDTSFGDNGKVVTNFANRDDNAEALVIQPDGKLVAGGVARTPGSTPVGNIDFGLVRYNTNGSLDTTFGDNGKVITNVVINTSATSKPDQLNDLVLQADGKIIAVGNCAGVDGSGKNDFAMVRYNANGTVDTSFGDNGRVTTDWNEISDDAAYTVQIQSNGNIILMGSALRLVSPNICLFTLARYYGRSQNGVVSDFDGDGKTDLSIFRPSVGEWWYQQSSNNSVKAFTFGTSSDRITPEDYDGDGKTDIAFWRPSTGEWFVLRSSNLTFFAAPFGSNGDTPAPGDFDNDGKADLVIFRSGLWFIQKSTGGVQITPFGSAGDIPQTADYDGDGKSDFSIFRPNGASGGEWWVNRSTAGIYSMPFGLSSDKPVAGDYTGDGKADIALFRPSTGEWFIKRSEDFSYYAAPFGNSTDVPAPGDYDGDGKNDLAVFRPSVATWYVLKSTGGISIQGFGAMGDKPVPSAFVP